MVKSTFNNLSPEKQEAFIQAALKEFAQHTYNDASVSRIVRTLAIAKGSFYQYFEDKKALYFYLKEQAEAKKRAYIQQALEQGYADFWELYRQLYVAGIQFDLDNPLYTAFLYNFSRETALAETVSSKQPQLAEGVTFFCNILIDEQQKGHLKPDLDPELMAYTLMQVGQGITDWLEWKYGIDFQGNIRRKTSVLGPNRQELLQLVDDLIYLLKFGMQHDPR